MLLLTSTQDIIQVITDANSGIDIHVSFADYNGSVVSLGRTNTQINSATTTTIVSAPGSSTQRNVKTIDIRNTSISTSCTVTVQHFDGTTTVSLIKAILQPGDQLQYDDESGWDIVTSGGGIKVSPLSAADLNIAALSLGGNTSGTLSLISSGTGILVGGTNVTLSQQGQSVVIVAGGGNNFSLNNSTGNVSLIAGSNITLSQNASSITINAQSQSIQTQGSIEINGSQGSIVLTAGNNITLSQNASTITISAQSQSVQTQNSLVINGSSGSVVLTAGNNITLSQQASTITISAQSQSVQTQNVHDVSLSGNTSGALQLVSSGTLILAGGNNVTLSQAGQSVTISAAQQTVQTQGSVQVNGSSGNISLVAGANISLSQNASTITISGSNQSIQTQNLVDISLSGNTAGVLALISSGTAILAGGNNVTLSQNGQSITISAANQSVQSQSTVAINASTGAISLVAGANISLSINASTITISASNAPTQTNQSIGIFAVSNTTGAGSTTTVDARSVSLVGAGIISIGETNGSIIFSAGAVGGGSFSAGVSNIGNTSGNTGIVASQVVLAGGNNVTLSQSINGNSATVTVSAANQSNQTLGIYASSQTFGQSSSSTFDARSISLVGSGIVTLGESGGSVIFNASTSQSVQTQNLIDASLSGNTAGVLALVSSGTLILAGGNNITLSQNGQSVTISGANIGGAQTGISGVQVSNTTYTSGTISFVNANGISFGSSGANGISVSYTVPNVPAQTNQTLGIFASDNTTGQSSSSTIDARSLSVDFKGIVSGGLSAGSLVISASSSQSVQTQNLVSINGSTGAIVLTAGANISLSQNASTITISASNQSVQSQNLFDLSLNGNTSGTLALVSSGTLLLAGGNNITLSQSAGSKITISAANQTVQTQNLVSINGSTGAIVFTAGANISLSQNASTITISASNQSVQTQNLIDVSLSGNTSGALALISSGTMILAGGNNITLSQNGQSVTISGPNVGGAQTGISGIIVSNTTYTSGTVSFSNANGISFGSSAGQAITASYTVPVQTVQTEGLYAVGNTVGQSSSSTFDARTVSFSGAGNVSVGYSAGAVVISGSAAAGNAFSAGISGGNTSGNTGTVSNQLVLAGGNNITLSGSTDANGMSATISAFTQTVQTQSTVQVNGSTGSISLVAGANISLSANASTITISASNQSVQTQNLFDLSLTGNTSGTMALVSSGTLLLAGGNNITLSQSAGSKITISAANQTVQTQNLVSINGSTGAIVFTAGANISLSQNASTITISASNQSVQTQNLHDVSLSGNTAGALALVSSGTLILAGGNNVTLSQNGQSVTISGVNTIAQTNQTLGLFAVSNTTQSSSGTVDARSLSFAGAGIASVGVTGNSVVISVPSGGGAAGAAISISGGNTSGTLSLVSTGTLAFAGSNNITLSQSQQTITILGPSISTAQIFISGNTTGTTQALSAGSLVFAGGNNITLSQNGNTVTISAGAGGGGGIDVSLAGNTTGTLALISSGTMILSGGNNITLSQHGQTVEIDAGGSLAFNAGSGITLSSSVNGVSSTLTISHNFQLLASVQNRQLGASTSVSLGQNSLWLAPFRMCDSVSASTLLVPMNLSGSSGTQISAQTATVVETIRVGLFTASNNSAFSQLWSSSFLMTLWNSGTVSASYSIGGVTSSSSAGTGLISSSIWGVRYLTIPINSTLPPGLYAFGIVMSTASTGGFGIISRNHAIMDAPLLSAGGFFPGATNVSIGYGDAGTFSVTTAAMPASFNVSQIMQTDNLVPYMKIGAI